MARRRPHRFVEHPRDRKLDTCVYCGLEQRIVLTIRHGEPVWSSAIIRMYRPAGAKFWTTANPACFQNVELRAAR
jgi:hypothetical protein